MAEAMIITVGGTPEPIIETIISETHQPEFICFFVSSDSTNILGEVLKMVKMRGHDYGQEVVVTEDPQDLVVCYGNALKCVDAVHSKGYNLQQVLVDYTGGTKTMTAAIALATIGKGFNFSYVGGKERTKDGLGVVVKGTEVIREGVGPWHIYAVEEKRFLANHINNYRFNSALEVLKKLIERGESVKRYGFLNSLKEIVAGYREWEAFRHSAALEKISTGTKRLEPMLEIDDCQPLRRYLEGIKLNLEFLGKLKGRTDNFENLSMETVIDLLSNAERRYSEGKFDDATARVYRAMEMVGQIEFKKVFEYGTDEVPLEVIPEELRKEYACKYQAKDKNKLKLPLEATFYALSIKDNEVGKKFFGNHEKIKGLQQARNHSILAHGMGPIKEEKCQKFLNLVRELFTGEKRVKFPKLEGDW